MQVKPQWEEISEFVSMAAQIAEKFPDLYSKVDVSKIIAYGCVNKERPESKAKLYEMSGSTEPESFTNTKTYFVKLFMTDWDVMDEEHKLLLVASALDRIDPETPGKVGPLDYRDQCRMVRTFGADWQTKAGVPHLLKDNINWRS